MKRKQEPSLFTLTRPFQKKASLMPSFKKEKSRVLFIRRHVVPFRLGITHWSSVLFLLDPRHTRQGGVHAALEMSEALGIGETQGRDKLW